MPRRTRSALIAVRSSVMCRALIPTPPVTNRFGSVKVGGSLGGVDGARSVGGESDTGLPSSRDKGNETLLFLASRSVGKLTLGSLGLAIAEATEPSLTVGLLPRSCRLAL